MRRICLLLATWLMVATNARATTLVEMSLEQMTAAAGAVARVRCIENESRAEGGEIWTFTRFEVLEALKGALPREITVRLIGGRARGLVSVVDGVPRFRPGEEAFLFLEPVQWDQWSVTGWVQGKFRVERDAAGRELVTQDTSGVAVFDPGTRQFRAGQLRNLPAGEFRRRVRAAVERQRSLR
jgi:hypothetical protein